MIDLPVFAGTNGAFSVAEVQEGEDLFFSDLVLSLVLMIILIFSLVARLSLFLELVLPVLL